MLLKLSKLFLKLGILAFGGPAAHIAMMNDEVVEKNEWLSQEEFLDLIAFTNLIPGPNSTELAILIGYKMAGLKGLIVAGTTFILPAMLIVIIFTSIYLNYQSIASVQNMLLAMSFAMITIIFKASLNIAKKTIKTSSNYWILFLSFAMLLLNVNEILVIVSAGLLVLFISQKNKFYAVEPFSFTILFLTFVKIGSLLYGSGYVLISFIQSNFVTKLGWLTEREVMDLVLIGEITPGPLFTTATAIGYYLGSLPGALIATFAIFVPSFLLIGMLYPFFEKIKEKHVIKTFLSGVSIASLAIMFHVVLSLTLNMPQNFMTYSLLIVYILASLKFKVNNIALIISAAVLGLLIF